MSTKSLNLVSLRTHSPARNESPFPLTLPRQLAIVGILGFLTVIGVAAAIGRLAVGLGATTALSDSTAWGIWIGFDFSLIAISGAGFTMAAVVHILHLHRFHAALRPALLVGLLGYSAVLVLLVLDLGRPDRFYHFLLYWNLHSPLFEISWCVLLYTTVLVIEILPDLCQRLGWVRLQGWAQRIMAPVTIIGVTLSTLHQSTLGTLYLNMPYRLDPRWYTALMPVLFYVSSIVAGLSMGVIAYRLATRIHDVKEEPRIIQGLGVGAACAALLYVGLRFFTLWSDGTLPMLLADNLLNRLLALELVMGVFVPAVLMLIPSLRRQSWVQWTAPLLMVGGVGLNRFDATLFAQHSPQQVTLYVPHIMEWLSTMGIIAGAALSGTSACAIWSTCAHTKIGLGGATVRWN